MNDFGVILVVSLQGHLLLIGVSGAGKTTLSRFVAWINGLSVYQIKVRIVRCLVFVSRIIGTLCVDR